MFVKTRESPSVVSTRVLRTHRLNEVETFRLSERMRSIEGEGKTNYCSISDEIDGVRKNLNKIKKVKNNLGISVERRKLLREKGYRVLPIRGLGDEPITLRGPDGKKVQISNSYDGEQLRRQLNINFDQLNLDDDDKTENSSDNEEEEVGNKKDFQYRIIIPPLRPGSRRNFKSFSDDESETEKELLLSEMTPKSKRKAYPVRPQTATASRKTFKRQPSRSQSSRDLLRARSATLASPERTRKELLEDNSIDQNTLLDQVQAENKAVIEIPEQGEQEKVIDIITEENTKENISHFDSSLVDAVAEAAKPERRKSCLSSKASVEANLGVRTEDSTGNERKQSNEVSSDSNKKGVKRRVSLSTETKLLQRRKSVDEKINVRPGATREDTATERRTRNISSIEQRGTPSTGHLLPPRASVPLNDMAKSQRGGGRIRTESFNSIASGAVTTRSTRVTPSRKHSIGVKQDEFAYDARPDKALSKGYSTMQMTIGGKQVKIFVPKFSTDVMDDVVERARAKSSTRIELRSRALSSLSTGSVGNKR